MKDKVEEKFRSIDLKSQKFVVLAYLSQYSLVRKY
jgi:hypothetical protein